MNKQINNLDYTGIEKQLIDSGNWSPYLMGIIKKYTVPKESYEAVKLIAEHYGNDARCLEKVLKEHIEDTEKLISSDKIYTFKK